MYYLREAEFVRNEKNIVKAEKVDGDRSLHRLFYIMSGTDLNWNTRKNIYGIERERRRGKNGKNKKNC